MSSEPAESPQDQASRQSDRSRQAIERHDAEVPEQTEPGHAPEPHTEPQVDLRDPTRGVTEHQASAVTSAEQAARDHSGDEQNVQPEPADPRQPRRPPEPYSGPSR